jgi:glycosyltransferase involved in cell wall biosynthesis
VKILFTSTFVTSFIREDLNILQRHFDVRHVVAHGVRALFQIPPNVVWADATFTWFASVYSFLVVLCARILRKKSIIVIGGVDAAHFPEIGYGIWLVPWKAVLVKWALRKAYRVLAVDPVLQREAARLAGYDGRNIEYVPTGYDALLWRPRGSKEPFVLTVAACPDPARIRTKGIDFLFSAARVLPAARFVLVGVGPDLLAHVRGLAPSNVEVVPFLDHEKLLRYYQRAKVYCQPSYTEGLPNSLCESMLCECIPVGTDVGGIPTAIADTGFLVPFGDVRKLADAIMLGLQSTHGAGVRARKRIAEEFPLERRERGLLEVLQEAAS